MRNVDTGVFFIAALIIGVLAGMYIMRQQGFIDLHDVKHCNSVCAPNDGIKFIYGDGACYCWNDAEFGKRE